MEDPEKKVEHTNSGIEKEGDWEEITDFAKDVEEAIEETSIGNESLDKYKQWRPRKEENKQELKNKTVEQASLNKKKPEKESEGSKDLVKASKRVVQATKKASKRENPDEEIKTASKEVSNFVMSKTINSVRKFEEKVYSDMMLKFNPYFFDASEFSVDMRTQRNGKYKLGVNIPDEKSREDVKKTFREDE